MDESTRASRWMSHKHTSRCYWDFRVCGWVCCADQAPAEAADAKPAQEDVEAEPAAASL